MMFRLSSLTRLAVVFCAAAFLSVAPAFATLTILSDTIFEIQAEIPDVGQARFDVPLTSGNIDGDTLTWSLQQPVDLVDPKNGVSVGRLETASVRYVADPVVVVNFLVSTGGAGANFTVTSAPLGFSPISGAHGTSTAGITATDNGGNGVGFGGNYPNNLAYRAFYNDVGSVPATGSTFSTLVPGIMSPNPNTTVVSFDDYPLPAGTYTNMDQGGNLLGTVSSMSAEWRFSVSALDSAGGTSFYEIVPEPGSCLLGLLAMVGLAVVRRR